MDLTFLWAVGVRKHYGVVVIGVVRNGPKDAGVTANSRSAGDFVTAVSAVVDLFEAGYGHY